MIPPIHFIANWKMKISLDDALSLTKEIRGLYSGIATDLMNVVICPSFTAISEISEIIEGSDLKLGAQDVFWEEKGAYTGEVSAGQLEKLKCSYVIIGHSERRQYLKETDEMVHEKVKLVLGHKLVPIICVGETFEERSDGQRDYVITRQVKKALEGIAIPLGHKIIVAYEPVWVIGSGQAVSEEDVTRAVNVIKQSLIDIYPNSEILNNFSIIYGGSVDKGNVLDFVGKGKMDGVLVSTASLGVPSFIEMIKQLVTEFSDKK